MAMKILLLEDDQILAASLKEYLETEGYTVDIVHRGNHVFDKTYANKYDLYILDINVPEIDGFDVLKSLREAEDRTPAIYITALTDINSISKGFKIGADDYIKKPFNPEELLIRISSKYQHNNAVLYIHDLEYNPKTRALHRNGAELGLGDVQKNIFHMLAMAEHDIVDSFRLMEFLDKPSISALRVNMTKLKKKLNIPIKNVRGQGYMIEKI